MKRARNVKDKKRKKQKLDEKEQRTPKNKRKVEKSSSDEEILIPTRRSPRLKNVEKPLQRTDTQEIIEIEETTLSKVNSLVRSSSSIKDLLGNDSDSIISSLSQKSQLILEKKLSEILSPQDQEVITIPSFERTNDIGEFFCTLNTDIDDENILTSLPSEILVMIFEYLNDEEKWSFARACKRFLSIFKVYVGWDQLLIHQAKDLKSSDYYSERSPDLKTNEVHFLQPCSLIHKFTPIEILNSARNSGTVPLYVDDFDLFGTVDNENDLLFLITQSDQIQNLSVTRSAKLFWHNRTSPIDLDTKKVIGCVPISNNSVNRGQLKEFLNEKFLSLFMGKGTQFNYGSSVLRGKSTAEHFVNIEASISGNLKPKYGIDRERPNVSFKFYLDVLRLGIAADSPYFKFCKLLKWILLRILHREVHSTAHLIKWSHSIINTKEIDPFPDPKGLSIKLHDYQQRGLAWMMQIEENSFRRKYRFCAIHPAPGFPTCDFYIKSGPFDFNDANNFEMFRKSDDVSYYSRPDLYDTFQLRGGFMADEMGLGKTVTMISLILANPRDKDEQGNYYVDNNDWRKKAKFEISASLVICPTQLVPQWEKEFKDRIKTKFNVITITTITHLKNLTYKQICNADVVITSNTFILENKNYMKLCGEIDTHHARAAKAKISLDQKAPLLQHFGWHRIILDEGHEVLSTYNEKFKKAEGKEIFHSYLSTYRWYVSGTPVPRGRHSLVGALNFLDIQLSSGIQLPELIEEDKIVYEMNLFTAVKRYFFWKNLKEDVNQQSNIPSSKESLILLRLSPFEQAIYDAAAVVNDVESMRMVCSQPLKTPFLMKLLGEVEKLQFETLMFEIFRQFRNKLGETSLKIQELNSNLKGFQQLINHSNKNIKNLDENPPESREEMRSNLITLLEIQEKNFQNTQKDIKLLEEDLIASITQAAIFSLLQDKDPYDMMRMKNCINCKKFLWEISAAPPMLIDPCYHPFCHNCSIMCSQPPAYGDRDYCLFCKRYGRKMNFPSSISASISLFIPIGDNIINAPIKSKGGNNNNNNYNNNNNNEYFNNEIIISTKTKDKKAKKKLEKRKIILEKLLEGLMNKHGTKLAALVNWTYRLLNSDDSKKVIIFSKSDDLLLTIGKILLRFYRSNPLLGSDDEQSEDEEEVKKINLFVTCKGNGSVRKKTIDQFNSQKKNSPRVLLLSLENAASGTHLTVASHIILADSVLGTIEEVKAADSQAIARAHRIGQEKNVIIVRFIVGNSIEYEDYLKVYGHNNY